MKIKTETKRLSAAVVLCSLSLSAETAVNAAVLRNCR